MIQIASIWKTIWNFATSLNTASKNCRWTHKGDNQIKILSFNQLLNTITTAGQEIDCRKSLSKKFSLISFYNWRIILINSSGNSRQEKVISTIFNFKLQQKTQTRYFSKKTKKKLLKIVSSLYPNVTSSKNQKHIMLPFPIKLKNPHSGLIFVPFCRPKA